MSSDAEQTLTLSRDGFVRPSPKTIMAPKLEDGGPCAEQRAGRGLLVVQLATEERGVRQGISRSHATSPRPLTLSARWLLLLLTGMVFLGCPTRPPCDASTCNGCCDDLDVCQQGLSSGACGRAGSVCSACGGGALCVAGVCSMATAPGGTGQSQPGTDQQRCVAYLNAMYDRCSPQVTAAQRTAVCMGLVGLPDRCLRLQRPFWDCTASNASTVMCQPSPVAAACIDEARVAAQPCN
jgi:hypothetical protein